ncbi:MAG TPA: amidohydrolase [Acidobacteriota bacterium]|nr:amidohydrolase [Acidobacteriota bacterium]
MNLQLRAILLIFFPLAVACTAPEPDADLVLQNGRIVTVDSQRPEVEALAIQGELIVAAGSLSEVEARIGPQTRILDLNGALAIPGFIEGHGHFMGVGEAKRQLDLNQADSWEEIVEMVREAVQAAQPGEWILGRGWHQEKWRPAPEPSFQGLPYHDSLSRASPDNPVLLTHASGHASFANLMAMELAGITDDTPDPPGGAIVRDEEGRAIGAFRETAQDFVGRALALDESLQSPEQRRRAMQEIVRLSTEECLANGITSFQDAGSSFETIDFLKELAENGQLGVRLYVMIRESNQRLAEKMAGYRLIGLADDFLTVRAVKLSIDGALGSHGAWLLEPYSDLPESAGHNTVDIETARETARLCMENGFQLCIHAIGDRANRETLDLFERVFKERPDEGDLRWRIEHAQHLHPDDIGRFAGLRVIASIQGIHATSDGPWVESRLGAERAREGAYVWRSLAESGALIVNGTDAPVEDVSPIQSYYASVTRRMLDGREFYPEQRMSRELALRTYTLNAAYATFEERLKGSLEAGKLADVVVLDRDILTVPEDEILEAKVLYTILGGKIVYTNPAAIR